MTTEADHKITNIAARRTASKQRDRVPVRLYPLSGAAISHYSLPLTWWRTRAADALGSGNIPILRRALEKFEFIGEDSWGRAREGDAPAAIGIALRIMHNHEPRAVIIDIPLSAVLCCAIGGDPSSELLLSAALRRRATLDHRCKSLSSSWPAEPQKDSARDPTLNRLPRVRMPPENK
jgi:hypothetical protein